MKHPNEFQLALFAGGDLGLWDRWRIQRHVSGCPGCESEIEGLRAAKKNVLDLAAELPENLNWDRLADEMTGNIRVGLAAGEAIARFDQPDAQARPVRLGWNVALIATCATAVFVAGFWIIVPQAQKDHLLAALQRIRSERLGIHSTSGQEGIVLEASSAVLEVKENGRTLSLLRPASSAVTAVSVSMKGSAGVRYVDADTGQVTTNKVYYAEQ
jgi:hypothetical protein